MFKSRLNAERFVPYKIKLNVNRSLEITIGYLETQQLKGHKSTLIVSRFYIYSLYRIKGYIEKAAETVFKELFIRFYSIKKLKIVIFENDLSMKHLLINQGYKLQESKTTTSITNIQLIYIITREEMRELKKKTDSNILDSIRFKRTENASNNILNNIKIKPNYEISSKE